MKMRIPSIPLITVDPYFSVWSHDTLNTRFPTHWTGSRNTMLGLVTVDGAAYRFLGCSEHPVIPQVSLDMDATTTTAVFENESIRLTASFTTPLLATDLYLASRPVSYLHLSYEALDGAAHTVTAKLTCSEELVLNKAGEGRALSREEAIPGLSCIRMGNGEQKVLWRCGDDLRIDWGYLYLAVRGEALIGNECVAGLYAVYAETTLAPDALFLFGYDDIDSILYFHQPLKAYWKQDGRTIADALTEAAADYEALKTRCDTFSRELAEAACAAGGEKYAELLTLAYRQVMAAHKLVVDTEGNSLYISKECFSNSCSATVDVTYPSAPMYLYYNTELLKGMLRPVLRFARSDDWSFDFAPHDVGFYPHLNGQTYLPGKLEGQMPVEECGNILILMAAICEKENSVSFAAEHLDLLEQWCQYLVQYGEDPANQLCTDDFAGHLSHNCNLSLKAIMGMTGYSRILQRLGRGDEATALMVTAADYARSFLTRAANGDGSYRLAYDRPGSFSLKYNAVWDKLWQTGLFPADFYAGEIARYKQEAFPYGIPLDSRERYTKSDWELWAACLADSAEDFEYITGLIWNAFHTMRTRVPMTDWYFADTSEQQGFQHRSVQGGLFLKLLMS